MKLKNSPGIKGVPLNGLNLVVSTLELGTTCLRDPQELLKAGKALQSVSKAISGDAGDGFSNEVNKQGV